MGRILFVPNTLAQLRKFKTIIAALPLGTDCNIVIIDRFKNDGTLSEAKSSALPYTELLSMEKEAIRALLEEQGAGIVVVGNDQEVVSRAFIDAAREKGIPSLLVQDGIICPYNFVLPVTLDFIPTAISIYGPKYLLTTTLPRMLGGKIRKSDEIYRYGTHAQYCAVWGSYSKRQFAGMGANPKNLFITGAPAMDAASGRRKGAREQILGRIGADPKKKTLLFVPSDLLGGRLYTRREYYETCDALCRAVAGQTDFQMVIKPHPSFLRREPHYFDRYRGKNIFISNMDAYEALTCADALVAEISSMILEAIAFGLPIAVVNMITMPRKEWKSFGAAGKSRNGYPCEPYPRIYVEKGLAVLIENKEEAHQKLRSILFDKMLISKIKQRQPAFIRDQLYRLDGKSAQRVAGLILRMKK